MRSPIDIGFYGKLPTHGDFLRRRVSDAFVADWDAWLQECVDASRTALGSEWLNVYLTSPAWRFVCAAGACGPSAVAGVMVPSVDRVGRYFPLSVVGELPDEANVLAVMHDAAAFFAAAEELLIETLEAEVIDFEAFDRRTSELGVLLAETLPSIVVDPGAAAILRGDVDTPIRLALGTPQLAPALLQVCAQQLAALYEPLVIWWSEGSAIVEPSCLFTRGLPDPEAFAAMLDGSWGVEPWHSFGVQTTASDTAARASATPSGVPPQLRSAGLSHVGKVRTINQDAFLERPEVGIWVVADGLGGHSRGEVASRMVCDAMASVTPDGSFEGLIDTVRDRLQDVNASLLRGASAQDDGRCGSTVVTLLVRDTRLAVLWAGDSRVYRWRHGILEQLTRDHSLAEAGALVGTEDSNVITRAVGGDETLDLDLRVDEVQAGDRFLLCSDGLTRNIPHARLAERLGEPDIAGIARGLVAATLDAGAPDNVTVVVVEAVGDAT